MFAEAEKRPRLEKEQEIGLLLSISIILERLINGCQPLGHSHGSVVRRGLKVRINNLQIKLI